MDQPPSQRFFIDPVPESGFDPITDPYIQHIFATTRDNAENVQEWTKRSKSSRGAAEKLKQAPVAADAQGFPVIEDDEIFRNRVELRDFRRVLTGSTGPPRVIRRELNAPAMYTSADKLPWLASMSETLARISESPTPEMDQDAPMSHTVTPYAPMPEGLFENGGLGSSLQWWEWYSSGGREPIQPRSFHQIVADHFEGSDDAPRVVVAAWHPNKVELGKKRMLEEYQSPVEVLASRPVKKRRKTSGPKKPEAAKKKAPVKTKKEPVKRRAPVVVDLPVEDAVALTGYVFDDIPIKTRKTKVLYQARYSYSEIYDPLTLPDVCAGNLARPVGDVVVPRNLEEFFFAPKLDNKFDAVPPEYLNLIPDRKKDYSLSRLQPEPTEMEEKTEFVRDSSITVEQQWERLWATVLKKDLPKAIRRWPASYNYIKNTQKKLGGMVVRSVRIKALRNLRAEREVPIRAKRLVREMQSFWKKNERDVNERRKAQEKGLEESRKREEELREQKRQQRKLEFLLSQTELFTHFISKKMGVDAGAAAPKPLMSLGDDEEDRQLKEDIEAASHKLIGEHEERRQKLNEEFTSLATPDMMEDVQVQTEKEPDLFKGRLKPYQLKGLNWLANLYEQGINGILADEMGLGKTIQSIVFLAHLCEKHNIWGPFLVVCPNSTLLQWISEINRFCPDLKVIPYWGDISQRKVIRKFWDPKNLYKRDGHFHVCVTSYQTFVNDEKYFQKIHWQYMVLDEAQAIKNSQSQRWQALLNARCRNRLLLTGTPIQNSMAELWALLHFIMPTIFDSHEEFNEWFSKDIESGDSSVNQVQRLHMILKPFMLRRVKMDVENEMAAKIEVRVNCPLSRRQREMYSALKKKIPVSEILTSANESSSEESLMNLVMQFRKVCNHPEIFERRFTVSPYVFSDPAYSYLSAKQLKNSMSGRASRDAEDPDKDIRCPWHNPISLRVPRLVDEVFEPSSTSDCDTRDWLLFNKLCMWSPRRSSSNPSFAFLDLVGVSSAEAHFVFESQISPLNQCIAATALSCQPLNRWDASPKRPSRLLWESVEECVELNHSRYASLQCFHERVLSVPVEYNSSYIRRQDLMRARLESGFERSILLGFDCTHWSSAMGNHSPMRLDVPSSLQNITLPCFGNYSSPVQCKGISTRSLRATGLSGNLTVPTFWSLLADSGKMRALDNLLTRLKSEGHRVLIFSQMTKMIDILEDYMSTRGHSCYRLDGSTDVFERRAMVNEFQASDETFGFLLSTRAGGLGITLTAVSFICC